MTMHFYNVNRPSVGIEVTVLNFKQTTKDDEEPSRADFFHKLSKVAMQAN